MLACLIHAYDAKNKRLIVNEAEAETARQLFRLYTETGSVPRLKEKADALGIVTKARRAQDGSLSGGRSFARGNLYRLLTNPIYRGLIPHDGQTYEGNHDAIVPEELWNKVQERMAGNARYRASAKNVKSIHVLTGLVFDETGNRLSPTHAIKKNHRYRYYISARIMRERRKQKEGWRVPAAQIERPVLTSLCAYLNDRNWIAGAIQGTELSAADTSQLLDGATPLASRLGQSDPFEQKRIVASLVSRIELHPDRITIDIDTSALVTRLSERKKAADLNRESRTQTDRIELKHNIRQRGVETKLVLTDGTSDARNPDPALVRTIAKSHLWRTDLTTGKAASIGELAERHGEDAAEVSRFLPLAWLAPDIAQNIFDGNQPVDLTLERLRRMPALPILWKDQRQLLGFET